MDKSNNKKSKAKRKKLKKQLHDKNGTKVSQHKVGIARPASSLGSSTINSNSFDKGAWGGN